MPNNNSLASLFLLVACSCFLTNTFWAQITDSEKEQIADFYKYMKKEKVPGRVNQVGLLSFIDGKESSQALIDVGLQDKDVRVRLRASWALSTKHDVDAIQFIKDTGLSHDNVYVREGVARALGKNIDAEKHVDDLVKLLKRESKTLVLIATLESLGRCETNRGLDKALELMSHKEIALANAAIDMIGLSKDPKAAKKLAAQLDHKKWEIHAATLRALGRIRAKESIDPILAYFARTKGRLHGDARRALTRITGRNYGNKAERWQSWWDRAKDGWKVPEEVVEEETASKGAYDKNPPTSYHQIKIESHKILFIIDVSASMDTHIRYIPHGSKTRSYKTRRRIDLAKTELIRVIKTLGKNTSFNVVSFEAEMQHFKPSLVKANSSSIAAAVKWVAGLRAYSSPAGGAIYTKQGWQRGGTNTFGALRYIYGLSKRQINFTGRLKPVADTVFFLSDGDPSCGLITITDDIVEQIAIYDKSARVIINTIAYDVTGIGKKMLSDIARVTGGKFVPVGSSK